MRSALRFQVTITPSSVTVRIASSDDSTIAASRAFASSVSPCALTSRLTESSAIMQGGRGRTRYRRGRAPSWSRSTDRSLRREGPLQSFEARPVALHLGAQIVEGRRDRAKAPLPAQVRFDRGVVGARVDAVARAVEYLVQREDAAGGGEADELDALRGVR